MNITCSNEGRSCDEKLSEQTRRFASSNPYPLDRGRWNKIRIDIIMLSAGCTYACLSANFWFAAFRKTEFCIRSNVDKSTLNILFFNETCGLIFSIKINHFEEYHPVALNCPSRQEDHFLAIKPKSGASEIEISETANQNTKLSPEYQSEFLERLDFLVTFLAMKKVT